MIQTILAKFGFPALLLVIAFGAGMYVFAQFFAPKPVDYEKLQVMIANEIKKIPKTECAPTAEVKLQEFDMGALKKLKGNVTYAPSLSHVTIRIDRQDSVLIKELLKAAR